MENNLENKAKLFALYWGQRVERLIESYGINATLWLVNPKDISINSFLELKPLSSINDEDALYLAKMHPKLDCKGHFEINPYPFSDEDRQKAIRYVKNNMPLAISNDRESAEYLRSKGYAIDWINLSVKKQIEYGWVKLKDNA